MCGKAPDGLIPEDSLQETLCEYGGASRDPHLCGGQPARGGEHRDHQGNSDGIGAERQEPGCASLGAAFLLEDGEDIPLPGLDEPLRLGREGRIRPTQRVPVPGHKRLPPRGQRPMVRCALAGSCSMFDDQRDEPLRDGGLDRHDPFPPGDPLGETVTGGGNPLLDAAHQVSRTDHVVPPAKHLPAEHGTIRGRTVDLLHRQPEFHLCRIPQLTDGGKLAAASIGQVAQFRIQPPDCTGQGLNRDGPTFLAIPSDSVEPLIQLRDQLCR